MTGFTSLSKSGSADRRTMTALLRLAPAQPDASRRRFAALERSHYAVQSFSWLTISVALPMGWMLSMVTPDSR